MLLDENDFLFVYRDAIRRREMGLSVIRRVNDNAMKIK